MKNKINLLNLVFFVPAVILSFAVWNDYKQDVAHVEDRLQPVEGLFYLDGGSKVISLTDRSDVLLFELLLSHGDQRSRKVNSQFVPDRLPVAVGAVIPVSVNKAEYEKELCLLQGKQGSANVTSVQFDGTVGERPFARITVTRNGIPYRIEQSIEPLYGVEVGDDLWVAYDEETREAVIVQYASA